MQYPEGYIGPKATRAQGAFADGTQTFRVVVPVDTVVTGDWNKNAFTQYMEEKTGLKVQFQTVTTSGPNGTDMTKVNAMLAAGDLPDAFLGIPFTRDQLSLYGSQGVFTPLDDLIETYAPQMRQAMTDYPDLAPLNKGTDGKTYTFAGLNDCYHCAISPGRALIYKPLAGQARPGDAEDDRGAARRSSRRSRTRTPTVTATRSRSPPARTTPSTATS